MTATTTEITPSRRRFIASALAAALGISLADVIGPGELIAAPAGCSTPGQTFVPVGEIVSKNNKLSATMTVKAMEKSVATIADAGYQCRTMKLRYYEGVDLNNPKMKWPANATTPGPGPTLRLRVGDQVHVRLVNAINPALFGNTSGTNLTCNVETSFNPPPAAPTKLYPLTDTPPSCLHGDNVTNLHYHGTHVTPDGHGDNVMIDVYPVGHVPPPTPPSTTPNFSEYTNDFTIPLPPPASNYTDYTQPFKMGQAPGTHWYHAHKHGAVALQLLNGMAGALIIEGEFDDQLNAIPGLHGLKDTEKVLVIQQIGDNINIQTDPQTGQPASPLNTCDGGNPLPLVNGQVQPTIEMKPGEIQRWRFVNATETQVAHLTYRFIGQDVYAAYKGGPVGGPFPTNVGYAPAIRQIAYDGVQLAPENYNNAAFGLSQEFTIAAGNRVDILVQAPSAPGKAVLAFRMLHVPPAGCHVPALLDPFLLNVNVSGPASPTMSFPTVSQFPPMPLWLQWNEADPRNKIVEERILKFNNDPTGRPAIDAKAFDGLPDTTQYLDINTAEQWTLQNEWASSIHPFHIHVNPFQVMEIFDPNNPPATQHTVFAPPYIWRDTIAIPQANDNNGAGPTTNGWVKIRSRYCDFIGTFVLHCHILTHEDRGMMETVVIEDPKMKKLPASAMSMHH